MLPLSSFGYHEDNCMKKQYVETVVETNIAVMIPTARKHPNALTAMAHTQYFHATAKHGKKNRRFFRSKIKDQLHSSKREKSLKSNCRLQLAASQKGAGKHVECIDAQTQPMRHTTFN